MESIARRRQDVLRRKPPEAGLDPHLGKFEPCCCMGNVGIGSGSEKPFLPFGGNYSGGAEG